MKTHTLQEVGRRAWAAIAEPGGVAVGNAGFVDLGGETLVFDTHVSATAGRALREAAERHGPVRTVVYSHWHGDHVYGANAMPGKALIVATEGTARLLQERAEPRLAEQQAAAAEITEGPFAELARTELPRLRVIHPDETFSGERAFDGARAITWGGGHTLSDAVLWLPEERVLFAGDLVVSETHPWVGDGDLDAWPEILDRIEELGPETIVPGHGPVSGPGVLDLMHEYLDAVSRAEPGDPVPARLESLAVPATWERNVAAAAAQRSSA